MVKVDLTRKPKIEGNNIIIDSDVKETMSEQEFKQMYTRKSNEFQQVQQQIQQSRNELMLLKDVEETPELIEFAKKIELAEKLNSKNKLQKEIQEQEVGFARLNKEMQELNPVAQQLMSKKAPPTEKVVEAKVVEEKKEDGQPKVPKEAPATPKKA